ncbi:MAG: DUF2281 domain-containing protein [Methylacidiphilales bacterium]|nr:DUF2281 domain-containing protein [Candidatus Methylacidiphilales bacterium]NJR15463.1 DUF2281 domain-containing protein [Calothrix sp. CSU_2_0]
MTIKEQLLQEIESSQDIILAETLDFLRFLKTKQTPNIPPSKEKPTYRPASGRSILRHAGTWEGDDFEECLQAVYATRGKAKFDRENPFE